MSFEFCNYRLVGGSFFIIKNSDLPKLEVLKPEDNEIDLYELKKINEKYNLYSNVVNLHESPAIKELFKDKIDENTLETSVYACIAYNVELRWKKGFEMIMIKTYSQFDNQGLPNKLEDIKPFQH